jgi:hypothetical protein
MVRLVGTIWTKRLLAQQDNYKLWVCKEMEQIGRDALNCHIAFTLHKREHDDRVTVQYETIGCVTNQTQQQTFRLF